MSAQQRVTITFGRDGGKVIKRDRSDSTDNGMPSSGFKQVVRERLGNNMVGDGIYGNKNKNKRQRTETNDSNLGDKAPDNVHIKSHRRIGQGDLRLKLLSKSSFRGGDSSKGKTTNIDLRQTLSRNRQASLKYNHGRLKELNASSSVQKLPPTKSIDERLPPKTSVDDLLQLDTHRRSYSLWPLEGKSHISPDRLISTSRGLSPPRIYKELEHTSLMRSRDASRPASSVTNGLFDSYRSVPYTSNSTVAFDVSKSVSQTHAASVSQRSLVLSNDPSSVKSLLHSLDLDKYSILFEAEEVDMTALRQMGDNDLKEMGIPMGPRKKILLAVLSLSKQRHR